MKKVLLWLAVFILTALVGLLGTKVLMMVAEWFELKFLTDLGFFKLYGLFAIIEMLNYRKKLDSIDGETFSDRMEYTLGVIFDKASMYLSFLVVMFLMYNILK